MNNKKDILSKIDRHSGMTVPEGYFDDFATKMIEQLPEHPAIIERKQEKKTTVWFRIRPYVYLAAMFAGIWCMLNMFNILGSTGMTMAEDPAMETALSDEGFIEEIYIDGMDENEILDSLYNMGISPETFDSIGYTDSYIDITAEELNDSVPQQLPIAKP